MLFYIKINHIYSIFLQLQPQKRNFCTFATKELINLKS